MTKFVVLNFRDYKSVPSTLADSAWSQKLFGCLYTYDGLDPRYCLVTLYVNSITSLCAPPFGFRIMTTLISL